MVCPQTDWAVPSAIIKSMTTPIKVLAVSAQHIRNSNNNNNFKRPNEQTTHQHTLIPFTPAQTPHPSLCLTLSATLKQHYSSHIATAKTQQVALQALQHHHHSYFKKLASLSQTSSSPSLLRFAALFIVNLLIITSKKVPL